MNTALPAESPFDPGPRAPGFWIRRYLPDKDAFILAPVDGEGPEFLAALDPQSPTRGRARETIMAALFGPRRSLAPVRLLVQDRSRRREKDARISAEKILTITDAFQTRLVPDADARKILDTEGRVISRWSDGLEDAVDHHGRVWLAQRALDLFAEMDAASWAQIRVHAATGLSTEAASALPENFSDALRGREDARQCRYNPNLPLPLQLGRAPTHDEQANYALQRACIGAIADRACAGDSALSGAQSALLTSRALVAVPPARSAMLLRLQTSEASRGIAAQLLAGLMELNAAAPATQEFDELWTPKPDGTFARRPSLHDEILREMAPHPIAQSASLVEKTQAYLTIGRARLARYEADARQFVATEQAKTTTLTREPTPPLSTELPEHDFLPGETPRGIKRFKRVGTPVASALDHAHKIAAEAEVVPWF